MVELLMWRGAVTPTSGYVEGDSTTARFGNNLGEIAFHGFSLLVIDNANSRIRRINLSSMIVDTIAGNGDIGPNDFNILSGLTNEGYFCDTINNQIKRVDIFTGNISAISGLNWNNTSSVNSAMFNLISRNNTAVYPGAMARDNSSPPNYYVADANNGVIKKITYVNEIPQISTIAGNGLLSKISTTNGPAIFASIGLVTGLAYYNGYLYLYSFARGSNIMTMLAINTSDYSFTKPTEINKPAGASSGLTSDNNGNFYMATSNNQIYKWVPSFDASGVPSSGTYSLLAGSGSFGTTNNSGTLATFSNPSGIIYDTGNLYVSETNEVRVVPVSGAATATLAGSAGSGSSNSTIAPTFNNPKGLAIRKGYLYVADYSNNRIRKISLGTTKIVTTVVGNVASDSKTPFDKPDALGTSAIITSPTLMFYDDYMDVLFTSDATSLKILTP